MPTTPKAETAAVDEAAAPDEESRLSRDATHSTYTQLDPPADANPPPGPQVEQTRGMPAES